MEFEYHHEKSMVNRQKHGLSLEEAAALWTVTNIQIQARLIDEPRAMIIGKINDKFYSCIFTVRGSVIRLISARRSRPKEEKIYHEHIRKEKADG